MQLISIFIFTMDSFLLHQLFRMVSNLIRQIQGLGQLHLMLYRGYETQFTTDLAVLFLQLRHRCIAQSYFQHVCNFPCIILRQTSIAK